MDVPPQYCIDQGKLLKRKNKVGGAVTFKIEAFDLVFWEFTNSGNAMEWRDITDIKSGAKAVIWAKPKEGLATKKYNNLVGRQNKV